MRWSHLSSYSLRCFAFLPCAFSCHPTLRSAPTFEWGSMSGEDMSNTTASPRYQGLFPVVPTTFTETGELDLASQKRSVDFMIDAGSDGLCILTNCSEQFVIADDERERVTVLEHESGAC